MLDGPLVWSSTYIRKSLKVSLNPEEFTHCSVRIIEPSPIVIFALQELIVCISTQGCLLFDSIRIRPIVHLNPVSCFWQWLKGISGFWRGAYMNGTEWLTTHVLAWRHVFLLAHANAQTHSTCKCMMMSGKTVPPMNCLFCYLVIRAVTAVLWLLLGKHSDGSLRNKQQVYF